jgi:AAA domain
VNNSGYPASACPLIGLVRERQALLNAMRRRESLLVLGLAGSGKTALLRSVLDSEFRGQPLVCLSRFRTPHELLVTLAHALLECGHRSLRQWAKDVPAEWDLWLARQTSVHLKGLLWNALEQQPVPIVLDGINGAGHQTYRFLQRLYFARGMIMLAAARDHRHLGELARLFWDPARTIQLHPLSEAESLELFEAAADHFRLRDLCLDDFRERVLGSAHGNPGQIFEMCRSATNPMYVTAGRHIKFAPLRIDVMMRFL